MDTIFGWFNNNLIKSAGNVLTYMSQVSINLFSNPIVDNVLQLMEYVGWILFAIGILFAIVNMYIAYLESETINLHLLVLNIFKGLIAILFLKAGAIRLFELSITMNELVSKITTTPNYQQSLDNVVGKMATSNFSLLWTFFIIIAVLISVVVCLIQILKRGGMYLAHIMVGYLYVFSIPSGNTEGFMDWCRQTVAIALTNVLQTALLYIGLAMIATDISKIFLGIGIIMAATKVEEIAGKYGLSTNTSSQLGAASKAINHYGKTAGGSSSMAGGATQQATNSML